MPNQYELVTGYDANLSVQLLKDNVSFVITSGTATVRGLIRKGDDIILGPVTSLEGAAGADWTTSLVVIPFTAAQTLPLTPNESNLALEVEVLDGDRLAWILDSVIDVRKGLIV